MVLIFLDMIQSVRRWFGCFSSSSLKWLTVIFENTKGVPLLFLPFSQFVCWFGFAVYSLEFRHSLIFFCVVLYIWHWSTHFNYSALLSILIVFLLLSRFFIYFIIFVFTQLYIFLVMYLTGTLCCIDNLFSYNFHRFYSIRLNDI